MSFLLNAHWPILICWVPLGQILWNFSIVYRGLELSDSCRTQLHIGEQVIFKCCFKALCSIIESWLMRLQLTGLDGWAKITGSEIVVFVLILQKSDTLFWHLEFHNVLMFLPQLSFEKFDHCVDNTNIKYKFNICLLLSSDSFAEMLWWIQFSSLLLRFKKNIILKN